MKLVRQSLLLLSCSLIALSPAAQQRLSNVSFEQVIAVAQREADVRIDYGPGEFQFGQLWLPENPASESVPLVVMIHGGCWLNSFDVSHTYGFTTALADAGFAVWALEYRRTGDAGGGWPGTYEDIKSGIRAVDDFSSYGVDIDRVAVLGHSAGGHLALLAGSDAETADSIDLAIGLAAIVDIAQYSLGSSTCEQAARQFMGGSLQDIPEDYAEANPVGKERRTRTVLFQGDIDQIVPLSQAELEGAATHIYSGAGHFDWIHPGTGAYATLLDLLKAGL